MDALRERGLTDGTITIHDDRSESHGMSPELAALFKLGEQMFAFKCGRPMRKDDVYFFDVDADKPVGSGKVRSEFPEPAKPQSKRDDLEEVIAEVRAAAQNVGVNPDRAVEHFLWS